MLETEEARAFWTKMDELAFEKFGINCGVPQGVLRVPITTNYKPLADFIERGNGPKSPDVPSIAEEVLGSDWKVIAYWETSRPWKGAHGRVFIVKNEKTKTSKKLFFPHHPHVDRLDMILETMERRGLYALRQSEEQAQRRLFKAISDLQRNQYVTGDFVFERGRSGVGYFIRKNRPTIASRPGATANEYDNPLCALCLHPVAYYTSTWAGVLPPSDEVLTHLLMIRDDEHFYWRKANQIPLDRVTSGV